MVLVTFIVLFIILNLIIYCILNKNGYIENACDSRANINVANVRGAVRAKTLKVETRETIERKRKIINSKHSRF